MKSLERVQILFKIIKILVLIGYIGSIVAFSLCLISASVLGILKDNSHLIELLARYDLTVRNAIGNTLSGAFMALFNAISLYYARKVCQKELNDGTPFTKSFVHDIRYLAVTFFICGLLLAIAIGIVDAIFKITNKVAYSGSLIGTGFMFLIMSLIFDYGADLNGGMKNE